MKNNRTSKKLKRNIIASSIFQLLSMIVPIITTPYITRIFNVSQIGDYNYSYAVALLFSVISKFGIDTYGVREIARSKTINEREDVYFQLVNIQITISIIMFIVFNFLFSYILQFNETSLIFIQSLLILVNIFDISWFYIGIEEISKTIIRNVATKLFSTMLIFILIETNAQLNLYALINISGIFLGNIFMVILSREYVRYKNYKFSFSVKYFTGSFQLLIPKLFNTSYSSSEKSILLHYSTSSNVGIYSEGQKIIKLLFSVIEQAFGAISPRMSYYVAMKEYKLFNLFFNKGIKYTSIFSIIFISGIFAVSTDFVSFFYGDGYGAVSNVLKALSFTLAIVPINVFISIGILIPLGKDREYTYSTIIMIVTGIFFNFLLTPSQGVKGAALAYFISEIFRLLFLLLTVRKFIKPLIIFKALFLVSIGVFINISFVSYLSTRILINNSFISFLILGTLSILVSLIYVITIFLFKKLVKKNDKLTNAI